jgi:hypothetical protein
LESGTITEAQFLITELQYTLGQLHVQLADLDPGTRAELSCGDRSVEQVLIDMGEHERSMQSEYARILGLSVPNEEGDAAAIAIPVSDEEVDPGSQSDFEQLRTQTIDMLTGTDEQWTAEMLDLVREHVKRDRAETTQIAECRKSMFADDSRPDLEAPLTTEREPHVLGDQSADVDTPQDTPGPTETR